MIAGVLAAIALALGFFTLAMNQSASQAAPHTILPLHARHNTTAVRKATGTATRKPHKAAPKPDPNFVAALQGGLPRSVAHALAKKPVVVVQLTSKTDPVAQLAAGEAKVGADDAGVSYVAVTVDGDGGDVQTLTRALGQLPPAPAALIYTRPAKLVTTLPNFNDRTVIEQAAVSAMPDTAVAANNTWATQANAICTKGNAEFNAVGKTDYAAQSRVSRKVIAQLTVLKGPVGEQTALHTANALLVQAIGLGTKVVALAAGGKNALPTYLRAQALIDKAFITYNRLGATVCTTAS